MSHEGTVMKSMRLDTSLVRQVETLAKAENRNFTNMVETILKTATKSITSVPVLK